MKVTANRALRRLLMSVQITNTMKLNRPLLRGEIRIFTRKRIYVLGRKLRPRDPKWINPNDPWFGLWSYAVRPGTLVPAADPDYRHHVGRLAHDALRMTRNP